MKSILGLSVALLSLCLPMSASGHTVLSQDESLTFNGQLVSVGIVNDYWRGFTGCGDFIVVDDDSSTAYPAIAYLAVGQGPASNGFKYQVGRRAFEPGVFYHGWGSRFSDLTNITEYTAEGGYPADNKLGTRHRLHFKDQFGGSHYGMKIHAYNSEWIVGRVC